MAQRTVLLVDGDSDSRSIFCAILMHHGYRVLEAEDGAEGYRLARSAAPDLIILEFPVPLPDGRTLTEAIKSDPTTTKIQVLTITTRAFEDDLELAVQAGSDAYLTKPVGPRRVLQEVERLLGPAPASPY